MTRRLSAMSFAFLLLTSLSSPRTAEAQQFPRDEYLRFVPLEVPRIIRQTPASERLHLYGDFEAPDYVDVDPLDGVDDRRHRVLKELAVRFAPFLVQNSEAIPMDHTQVRGGHPYPLNVDTWNTAMGLDLIRQETVDWMEGAADPCTGLNPTSDDCRLLELLRWYNPDDPIYAAVDRHAGDGSEELEETLEKRVLQAAPIGIP